MKLLDGVSADATVSPCGGYRYSLTRTWQPSLPSVLWIMLNPSTADAEQDDPTLRRCQHFAHAWGYGGIYVVNLFALRSPDPRALRMHYDPVGPGNDLTIASMLRSATVGRVLAAWGAHGSLRHRDATVIGMARRALYALGLTKDGMPKHPLARGRERVPDDAQPVMYRDVWRDESGEAT